ncbi:HotDog domain-containing protein [Aspergillus carlsbadensis]|nr:HotDog domain-containing protein [Aspergillus carlsbadensis]
MAILNSATEHSTPPPGPAKPSPPSSPSPQEIDAIVQSHPLTLSLRSNPTYTESRPHATTEIPDALQTQNLLTGLLAGPHAISIPPYIFTSTDERKPRSMAMIMHLGSDVCGHPGIVHGGIIATLFDEGFARCCFGALPHKVGVTANLNIDYREPVLAGSLLVMWAEVVRVEGRKVWGRGRMETMSVDGDGEDNGEGPSRLVAEASVLCVEPREAANWSSMYKAA